jgi:hypothetical protein
MPRSTALADTGNGATVVFTTSALSLKIRRIEFPEERLERILASHLGTTVYNEYIPADLTEPPEMTFEFIWDTFDTIPTLGGVPETVTITWPLRAGETTPANRAGTAYVAAYKFPDLANGEIQVGRMVVAYDGGTGPTYTKST